MEKFKNMDIRTKCILAAATAVALAFIAFICIVAKGNNAATETNQAAQTTIITNEAPSVSIEAEPVAKINNNPFAGRYVTYQGLSRIEKEKGTYLINPEENDEDVYMEFVVSENGEVLYSSELIAAGKGLEVNFSDFLSEGSHKVTITMNPYVLVGGDYLKCPVNNAQDVDVTI